MYAVIASGGKQYRVKEGDTIKIEKTEIEQDKSINFNKVLLLSDDKETKIGTPYLTDVEVNGKVVEHGRDKKINILKFKRRKQYMKQQGHRQSYTKVTITKIGMKKPGR